MPRTITEPMTVEQIEQAIDHLHERIDRSGQAQIPDGKIGIDPQYLINLLAGVTAIMDENRKTADDLDAANYQVGHLLRERDSLQKDVNLLRGRVSRMRDHATSMLNL